MCERRRVIRPKRCPDVGSGGVGKYGLKWWANALSTRVHLKDPLPDASATKLFISAFAAITLPTTSPKYLPRVAILLERERVRACVPIHQKTETTFQYHNSTSSEQNLFKQS